jgi:hypothetical protein
MAKRQNRQFWESASMNNANFMQYYNRLTELSISTFDWQNLPETIDPRFLELVLFGDGKAIFFKDEVLGFLALRCTTGGQFNVYMIPNDRYAYATNGYQAHLDQTNSVIIYNNMIHTPSSLDVEVFAKRLYNLDRTIDVNINAQKTPVLIQCGETERLTMKNLYKQYEGNEPFIFGDKNLRPDAIKVLQTGAPYVSDRLYTLKTQIWNEALTYLGISNMTENKKERLLKDEVQRNQGGTISSRKSRLKARQQACDEINKMFDLNISCVYNESDKSVDEDEEDAPIDTEMEGDL